MKSQIAGAEHTTLEVERAGRRSKHARRRPADRPLVDRGSARPRSLRELIVARPSCRRGRRSSQRDLAAAARRLADADPPRARRRSSARGSSRWPRPAARLVRRLTREDLEETLRRAARARGARGAPRRGRGRAARRSSGCARSTPSSSGSRGRRPSTRTRALGVHATATERRKRAAGREDERCCGASARQQAARASSDGARRTAGRARSQMAWRVPTRSARGSRRRRAPLCASRLELGGITSHALELVRARIARLASDRGRADARREALEPEPRGVDLLEVLARQPADERPAGLARPRRAPRARAPKPDPDGCLRDAEPLREVALDERRPLRQLAADDQRRAAIWRRASSTDARSSRWRGDVTSAPPSPASVCSPRRDLRFHIADPTAMAADRRQLPDRRRRRRHLHRRDPARRRRPRPIRKLLSTPPSYDRAVVEAVARPRRPARRRRERRPRDDRRDERRARAARRAGPRSSPPPASATCSSCAACGSRTCTTLLAQAAAARRRAGCASRSASAWPPTATVLRPLDEDEVRALAGAAARGGRRVRRRLPAPLLPLPRARAAARRDPARGAARTSTVSLSSEILREQREYERSATTVVNAYVRPLMGRYVGRHPPRPRRRRASTRR